MKKTLLFVFMLVSVSVFADSEHYFRFVFDKSCNMRLLSNTISIDNIKDGYVYAYSNDKELSDFRSLGIEFELLTNPSLLCCDVTMIDDVTKLRGANEWNAYPTYSAYIEMMNSFAADYPEFCEIINIGKTVNGKELLVAKITANNDKVKPSVLMVSSMHGDETTGYVLMLRLIDYLLTQYSTDDEITNIIDNTIVYINPLHNPDGTYRTSDETVVGSTRYNANYVDLNRNFPDPFGSQNPTGLWQPETVAFMDFAKSHNTTMSMNLHGGVELINYPWDNTKIRHADDSWLVKISRKFATLAQNNSPANYFTDKNNGITNGYDWYPVSGSRQDYVSYYTYGREFTAEISNIKLVKASELPKYWDYLKDSFIYFIDQAQYGIRGKVTDINSGKPVKARVFVKEHDMDNSFVYSDSESGCFFRTISEGEYTLIFTAEDYKESVIVENIVVEDNSFVELDIKIGKKEVGVNDAEGNNKLEVYVHANDLTFNKEVSGNIVIYDITGRIIEKGICNNTSQYRILSKMNTGIYLLNLVIGGAKTSKKIFYTNSDL